MAPAQSATSASRSSTSDVHGRHKTGTHQASSYILALWAILGNAGAAVITVAVYNHAKKTNNTNYIAEFWLAVALALSAAVVVVLRGPTVRWVLAAVAGFAVFTYLPKYVMSHGGPIYFDEFAHVRHAQDMLASGNLGTGSPLLPVVQYFPGLGVLTIGVHKVTALSIWNSGQLVIFVAHTSVPVLVYLLARSVRVSVRASGLSACVYALNPSFLYFDSQYAYESLAIPFMVCAMLCTVRAASPSTRSARIRWVILGVVSASATVLTHHVTALFTAGACLLLAGFQSGIMNTAGTQRLRSGRAASWTVALWAASFAGVWVLVVSRGTRAYLLPSLRNGVSQLAGRFSGTATRTSQPNSGVVTTQRSPFAGSSVPYYEIVLGYAAPVLLGLLVIASLWRIIAKRQVRLRELRRAAPFIIMSLGYVLSLPLVLTSAGSQAAHRSWPFFFVGMAVLAVWRIDARQEAGFDDGLSAASDASSSREASRFRTAAAFLLLFVLGIGNVTDGANIIYRFPGPFALGSDNRFQSQELNGLVSWADRTLPSSAGIVADRSSLQLFEVRTRLKIPSDTESFVYQLYRNPSNPPPTLRAYLRDKGFRYFVLDTRILDHTPNGPLFQGYQGDSSVNVAALAAVRNNSFIRQIYSTSNYRVFQLTP